jgi:hypothetical protein
MSGCRLGTTSGACPPLLPPVPSPPPLLLLQVVGSAQALRGALPRAHDASWSSRDGGRAVSEVAVLLMPVFCEGG